MSQPEQEAPDIMSPVNQRTNQHQLGTGYGTTLLHWLGNALANAIPRCVALLSLRQLRWLGRIAGRAGWRMRTRARDVALTNLGRCFPALSSTDVEALARQALLSTGELAFEAVGVWCGPLTRTLGWIERVEGAELLEQAVRSCRGAICVVPHLGNWEMLNAYLGRTYAVTAMFEPLRWRWLTAWLVRARGRSGARLLPADRAGLRHLLRTLANGGVVAVLPDQVPVRGAGMPVSFFGLPAQTATLVARLAATTQSPLFLCTALRAADPAGFVIRIEMLDPGVLLRDTTHVLSMINACIERAVMQAPAQYQWTYKRFKHAQPGRDVYKD